MTTVASPPRPTALPGAPGTGPGRITPAQARRSIPLIAAGLLTIGLAALLAGTAFTAVDNRIPVVVTARDLPANHEVSAADLRIARLTLDTGVRTVPAATLAGLIGHRSRTALAAGTVLAPGQLDPGDGLGTSEAIVGVSLADGTAPPGLAPGDLVLVVDTGTGEVLVAEARVRAVIAADPRRGRGTLALVVPRERAATILAAAEAGHIGIGQLPARP